MNELPVLSDPQVFPSDEVIFSHIGNQKKKWLDIHEYMRSSYKDAVGEWRFYNDGKQWLFKMQYKKKTVFWCTIFSGSFRITFYFGGKAESVIVQSKLSESAKNQFLTGPNYGKIRAITYSSDEIADINEIFEAIKLKISLK